MRIACPIRATTSCMPVRLRTVLGSGSYPAGHAWFSPLPLCDMRDRLGTDGEIPMRPSESISLAHVEVVCALLDMADSMPHRASDVYFHAARSRWSPTAMALWKRLPKWCGTNESVQLPPSVSGFVRLHLRYSGGLMCTDFDECVLEALPAPTDPASRCSRLEGRSLLI